MIPMKQTYSFNFFHIYGIYGVSVSVVHLEKKQPCCTPVTAVVIFLSLRPRNTGHGSLPSW